VQRLFANHQYESIFIGCITKMESVAGLVEDIVKKEQRILEIMDGIRQVLAGGGAGL
jgi:hypothetical protein